MAVKIFGAAALGGAMLLTACGGGGGGGTSETTMPDSATGSPVAGNLDGVQAQAQSILSSFTGAADGTPLEAIVKCGGDLVNQDALDFADTILSGIPTGGSISAPDPVALANSLVLSASDLTGLITALAGTPTTCSSSSVSLGDIETAFALLDTSEFNADQLIALDDLQLALEDIVTLVGMPAIPGAPVPSADTLTALTMQLSDALSDLTGSSTPSSLPGLDTLTAVSASFSDVSALLGTAGTSNPTSAIQSLISTSLLGSLTQIVPVDLLGGAGSFDPTTLISQISSQAVTLSTLFGAGLPAVSPAQLTSLNSLFSPLGPLSSLTTAFSFLSSSPGSGTGTCVFAGLPIPGSSSLCSLIPV